jgi:hypothetical protein
MLLREEFQGQRRQGETRSLRRRRRHDKFRFVIPTGASAFPFRRIFCGARTRTGGTVVASGYSCRVYRVPRSTPSVGVGRETEELCGKDSTCKRHSSLRCHLSAETASFFAPPPLRTGGLGVEGPAFCTDSHVQRGTAGPSTRAEALGRDDKSYLEALFDDDCRYFPSAIGTILVSLRNFL